MKILDLLRREPVRVYIYGLASAIVGLLLYYGVVTTAGAPLIIAAIVAALALPSPVETLRGMVTPVAKKSDPEERQ